MKIDTWEYTFEIQIGWFPGGGWMRAPYFRETWDAAWQEAETWAKFGARSGQPVSIRIIRLDRTTHKQIQDNFDTIEY